MKSALELLRELRRDGNSFGQLADAEYGDGTPVNAHTLYSGVTTISGCQIRQNRQNSAYQIFVLPAYVLCIWSEVLSEEVLVVPDDVPAIEEVVACGRIVYKHSEIHSLFGVTPSSLRLIHEIKRVIGGDVIPDNDNPPKQFALLEADFSGTKTENDGTL